MDWSGGACMDTAAPTAGTNISADSGTAFQALGGATGAGVVAVVT